ncbi:hypothetical protein M408DRAFT_331759 [Serendipita vermifera MAFF 305830]|uniref:Uncharacterized protein n=1 Tax=Serendipita vermifera MAFF 305830 TaxID=933852 RepID=A0A0C2X5F3_SERVB|nr:hypothetical protein M408DRAFT_331759 [Serendipita vermifera MAFF 305830]
MGHDTSKLSDEPRILVVTGLGGCGKTQLILKFMRVHEADFSSLFFIDGSSRPRIRADITRYVRAFGAEHSQMGFDDCLAFLSQPSPNGPRLILYDNVDDPDLDLPPLLPRGGSCAVLITSRNRSLGELAPESHLELDVMTVDESVELLLYNPDGTTNLAPGAQEDARAIAEALGCLPIALTQARSYMYQTKCTARSYLERLLNGKGRLLSHPIKNHPNMRYVSTYAAFDASFEMLPPRVQQVLRLLSCFHWGDFPLELIVLAAKFGFSQYDQKYIEHGDEFRIGKAVLEEIFLSDGQWDVTTLDNMLIALQNYSLVTLAPGVDTLLVQIHPVAHEWARSRIPNEEQAQYQAAALLLLALGAREEYTPSAQYLSSHAAHMNHLWDHLHINNAGAFGSILREGGLLHDSLNMKEKVVSVLRQRSDSSTIALANALHALATAYYGLGRLKQAEDVQVEVLQLRREAQGERHPKTLQTSSDLSRTYVAVGRLREAEILQATALKLRRQVQGERHPDTIAESSILAETYRDLGRYTEARDLEEEVLRLRTEILGPRHPETIKASNNLGCTYHSMGRYDDSERVLEEVLRLLKEVVGERHPDTLDAYGNLANVYRELGRLDEAAALQSEALRLRKDILGERHPGTARAMLDLAEIRVTQGKGLATRDLVHNAGSIISETLGQNNRWYSHYLDLSARLKALEESGGQSPVIKSGTELVYSPKSSSFMLLPALLMLIVAIMLASLVYYSL